MSNSVNSTIVAEMENNGNLAATIPERNAPRPYRREHIDLGVLGGMGPQATQYFVEELLRSVEVRQKPRHDQEYPNVLVRFACYLPDRTTALERNLEPFAEAFIREANALLDLGCPKIVVPCITAHSVIQPRMAHLPVVDLPRVVAAHLRNTRPGARVGVLATRGTRLAGVIDKFVDEGQEVVVLPVQEEKELMAVIYEKAKSWQGLNDLSAFGKFADRLRERKCDVVIAGCTEIEMFLARGPRDTSDLIFPLRIVAEEFAASWKPATA